MTACEQNAKQPTYFLGVLSNPDCGGYGHGAEFVTQKSWSRSGLLNRSDGSAASGRGRGFLILAEPFVNELNWATGIDAKGRPIVAPNMDPSPAGVRVCPTVHGATNWWSPSLNPDLGLFFVVALE